MASSVWTSPYVGVLVVVKFLRAVGLFMSYDLLKLIPVVQFLFIIKAGSTLPLLLLQKPFSSGKSLSKNHWFRAIRHALFGGLINLLWLFGLTLCGPLRTILLFEHSDLVIIAGACAIFTNNGGGPSKMRGAIFFIIAVITLLLFDHDERLDNLAVHELSEIHQNIFTHLFYHVVNFIGWSDHKNFKCVSNTCVSVQDGTSDTITPGNGAMGGVVLLAITLFTHVGYSSASKKLSVDIGGSKRLHALSTLLQAILLFPWMVFMHFTRESYIESWLYLLFPLTLIILFVFVVDFYIEAVVTNHLQPPKTAVYGTYAIIVSALFLGLTWNHPMMAQITTLHKLREIVTEDHVLSGGVVLSLMTFLLASSILGFPSKPSKGGSFVGYSPSGLPLYSFTGEALHKTSQSVLSVIKNGLRQILEDSNSRKIFYFLCINLIFTFVELVYGVWTNSLGLISDGFHMLFDCSALVMGLYAAIMSRWKATRIFSYGYDRVEILSGFINGLFLVVIGIFVFTEAIERLHEPPVVKTERLLTVSVIGLLVNLVGITAFRSSHTHGHGGHGHSHGGGHSHQGDQHGHSHGAPSKQDHNINMEESLKRKPATYDAFLSDLNWAIKRTINAKEDGSPDDSIKSEDGIQQGNTVTEDGSECLMESEDGIQKGTTELVDGCDGSTESEGGFQQGTTVTEDGSMCSMESEDGVQKGTTATVDGCDGSTESEGGLQQGTTVTEDGSMCSMESEDGVQKGTTESEGGFQEGTTVTEDGSMCSMESEDGVQKGTTETVDGCDGSTESEDGVQKGTTVTEDGCDGSTGSEGGFQQGSTVTEDGSECSMEYEGGVQKGTTELVDGCDGSTESECGIQQGTTLKEDGSKCLMESEDGVQKGTTVTEDGCDGSTESEDGVQKGTTELVDGCDGSTESEGGFQQGTTVTEDGSKCLMESEDGVQKGTTVTEDGCDGSTESEDGVQKGTTELVDGCDGSTESEGGFQQGTTLKEDGSKCSVESEDGVQKGTTVTEDGCDGSTESEDGVQKGTTVTEDGCDGSTESEDGVQKGTTELVDGCDGSTESEGGFQQGTTLKEDGSKCSVESEDGVQKGTTVTEDGCDGSTESECGFQQGTTVAVDGSECSMESENGDQQFIKEINDWQSNVYKRKNVVVVEDSAGTSDSEVFPMLSRPAKMRKSHLLKSDDDEEDFDEKNPAARDISNKDIYVSLVNNKYAGGKNTKTNRIYDSRHPCIFCSKTVCNFSHHILTRKHKDEEEVKEILDSSGKERKNLIAKLRLKAAHNHNMNVLKDKKGELFLLRRSRYEADESDTDESDDDEGKVEKCEQTIDVRKYGPCPRCLGWILRTSIKRHFKVCCAADPEVSHSYTKNSLILQSDIIMGKVTNEASPSLVKEVFPIMLGDEISKIAKRDDLIVNLGNQWMLRNRGNEIMRKYYTSSVMRLAAKLKKHCQTVSDLKEESMDGFLQPKHFDVVVKAALLCSSGDEDLEDLKSPSNAVKLGHDIKRMLSSKLAKGIKEDDNQKRKEAEGFRKLMDIEWGLRVTKLARSLLNEATFNQERKLPLPSDLKKLAQFLTNEINDLDLEDTSFSQFRKVAVLNLVRITLYNRRRCHEVQATRLTAYAMRKTGIDEVGAELRGELTDFERHLLEHQDVVVLRGKTGRGVPVILPNDVKSSMQFLSNTTVRKSAGIPPDNKYVFANAGAGVFRAYDAIRDVTQDPKAGLQMPTLIRTSNLRKYTATMLQAMDTTETERQWIIDHLGHTMNVHREHYRQTSDILERVEVAKILLIQDLNLVAKFHGKKLKDIQLDDIVATVDTDSNCTATASSVQSTEHIPVEREEAAVGALDEYIPDLDEMQQSEDEDLDEAKKRRKKASSRQMWTQEETDELENLFSKELKINKLPGQKRIEELMFKSQCQKGVIHLRKRDTVKKKLCNMMAKKRSQTT